MAASLFGIAWKFEFIYKGEEEGGEEREREGECVYAKITMLCYAIFYNDCIRIKCKFVQFKYFARKQNCFKNASVSILKKINK